MKIAIYEIVHLDWVIPLAELLCNSPYEVSFFVHTTMKKDIESTLPQDIYNRYKWIYLRDESIISRYRFLSGQLKKHHYDIFWLNTADSKHLVFALLRYTHKQMRLLINVHELNNFFRSDWSLNIKQSLRHMSKKLLAKMADAYLVNAERMNSFVNDNKLTMKPCYTLAPVYYKKSNIASDIFSVTIPGMVDERRRDYQTALQAWKIFLGKKDPVIEAKLILAGKITGYGNQVSTLCNMDSALKASVRLYLEDIPETIFQELIASTSVLLSPQVIESSTSDGIKEIYGITKNSGNSYDAIRHAKPFIIPKELTIPKELETSTIRYSTADELAEMLIELCNNKQTYNLLAEKAQKNSEKFSFDIMREKVEDMIRSIKA